MDPGLVRPLRGDVLADAAIADERTLRVEHGFAAHIGIAHLAAEAIAVNEIAEGFARLQCALVDLPLLFAHVFDEVDLPGPLAERLLGLLGEPQLRSWREIREAQ